MRVPLRKKLNLSHESKIIDLAERGGADMGLEGHAAIQHGIEIGRGGFYLNLTDEQYRKLL